MLPDELGDSRPVMSAMDWDYAATAALAGVLALVFQDPPVDKRRFTTEKPERDGEPYRWFIPAGSPFYQTSVCVILSIPLLIRYRQAKKRPGRYKRIKMVRVYPFPVEPDKLLHNFKKRPLSKIEFSFSADIAPRPSSICIGLPGAAFPSFNRQSFFNCAVHLNFRLVRMVRFYSKLTCLPF